MIRKTNLRSQVLVVILAISTLTVALSTLGVFLVSTFSVERDLDQYLLQLAKTELASATDTGKLHVHETGTWSLEFRGIPGYEKFVWVQDLDGKVLAETALGLPMIELLENEKDIIVLELGEGG